MKKSGALRISHEAFRATKMAGERDQWLATFSTAVAENKGMTTHLTKAVEDLNPLKVLELFKRVTAEVCEAAYSVRAGLTKCRMRSFLHYTLILEDQRTTSGNTFLFLHLAFGLRSLRKRESAYLTISEYAMLRNFQQ